jgi:uncharacterized membrane protein
VNDTLIGALAIAFSIVIPPMPGQKPDKGPTIPPKWSYNPSSWPQRLPIAALGCIGWFISRYLAAYQLGYIDQIWDPLFGTGTSDVLRSDVSRAFPVSDAGLGALAYTLEFLLTCQGGENRWRSMPWMVVLFGILVVPLSLISIILIILQPIAVGAWCFLCLATGVIMLIMAVLAVDEVAAVIQYLRTSREKPFWQLFWQGGVCPGASRDTKSPPLTGSMKKVLKAGFYGVRFSWSMLAATFAGLWLMLTPWVFELNGPIADWDHVLGPLMIVASSLSLADATKQARYFNLLLALGIAIGALIFFREQSWSALCNHFAIVTVAVISTLNRK